MTEPTANALRDIEVDGVDAGEILSGAVALGHEMSIEVSEDGEVHMQAVAMLRCLSDMAAG